MCSGPGPRHAFALGLGIAYIAAASVGGRASATNLRYAPPKPVFVKLEFDGDAAFPSITTMRPTPGLQRFTGVNFGLTAAQRTEVIQKVTASLTQDYIGAGMNIELVTDTTGIPEFYTWGIDDSALVVFSGTCTNPGNSFIRVFGKAGIEKGATDCGGASIYFPRHARTWAGSLTVLGVHAPSQPALRLGDRFADGTVITTTHVAQAIANSAAHEIGHLFGLKHPDPSCAPGSACESGRLMFTANETIEARNDKSFTADELGTLRTVLGTRWTLVAGPDGVVRDPETGLVMTADANLVASRKVGAIGGNGDGTLSFADAQQYTAGLDYLGYNDWRLPDALPPSGVAPPCSFSIFGGTTRLTPCFDGEVGLFARNFINSPQVEFFTGLTFGNWETPPPPSGPWAGDIVFGQQYLASSSAPIHAWPVRAAYTLIDAGDGTVVDPARRLMWMREPAIFGSMNQFDAGQAAAALSFAGYGDWRLPRVGPTNDATCSNTDLFTTPRELTSTGCSRSELGQLYQRWGVREGFPASPFVLPTGSGSFWYEDVLPHPGAPWDDQPFFFDFRYGKQGTAVSTRSTTALGRMWPVRDLEPGYVARGNNVVLDVSPAVVVRLRRVDRGGTVVATVRTASPPPRPPLGNPKTYSFESSAGFDRSDENANEICIRYTDDELPLLKYTTVAIQRTVNGGSSTILSMVDGYPDFAHHIACAHTAYLTEFKVVAVSTRPVPIPIPFP